MKKNIVITGGKGFLAKHFCNILQKNNSYNVISTANDIRDLRWFETSFDRIDYFINCAGISTSKERTEEEILSSNSYAVSDLLSFLADYHPQSRFVNFGSALELEEKLDIYGHSKALSRISVNEFAQDGYFAIQPYLFNTVGKHQSNKFFFPKLLNCLLNSRFAEFGNLFQIKSFQHIEDVVELTMQLLNLENPVETHLGHPSTISLFELVEKLLKRTFTNDFHWSFNSHGDYKNCPLNCFQTSTGKILFVSNRDGKQVPDNFVLPDCKLLYSLIKGRHSYNIENILDDALGIKPII